MSKLAHSSDMTDEPDAFDEPQEPREFPLTFVVRQKTDDEGYQVFSRAAGYLAADAPGGLPIEDARMFAASRDLYFLLKEAKRELWDMARETWTVADFKRWALIQQIDAALTAADGVAR